MTVIAWDGDEMVSDSLCSAWGEVFSMDKKLYRLKSGAVLGTAGDADCREVMGLLDLCETEADLPTKEAMCATRTSFQGLLWLPDRTMWMVDISVDPTYNDEVWYGGCYSITGKKAVAGCGGGLAIAVMDAGLSAYEAVKVAIKRNLFCGGPIQRMKLEAPKPKKKKKLVDKSAQIKAEIEKKFPDIIAEVTKVDPEKEAIG